jgi:alpha-acetolactate decarboxylase
MNPFDGTHVTGLLSETRPRLDVDEPDALHTAITPGPDLLVQHTRPIVADLVGSGRMGLGTLLAPADPMVIMDASCYRLDAGMSACRVSPLERVHCATVADFRDGSRFRIEYPVPRANVARLVAQVFGALPHTVAVELSGTFSGLTVPNGTFDRADGTAVGFVTRTSPERDWHLSFLTADRTFGGPILEISIENVELKIVPPRACTKHGQARKHPRRQQPRGLGANEHRHAPEHRSEPARRPRTSLSPMATIFVGHCRVRDPSHLR